MVNSFDEVQFPPQISYGAVGGPKFKTTVLTLASGYEKRNVDWAKTRGEWDVAYGLKTQVELEVIREFFMARRGRATGFRFKDWIDYTMARQVIGTTDGTTATFQIYKRYPSGASYYDRDIKKPVNGTIQVWIGGIIALLTTDYTVDITTGIITLSNTKKATTGQDIEVACQFDVPVRFDTDHLANSIVDFNVFSWGQIPLVELKL